jgi:predicted DNA-binding protein (MmcQ/YjbR family)
VNLDPLRRYCAALPGATRDIKWGADEVYSVGGKMVAVLFVDGKKVKTASFRCDPERFLERTDQPGIVPAPYLARAHWVQVRGEAKALTGDQVRAPGPIAFAGLCQAHPEAAGCHRRKLAGASQALI